MSKNEIEIDGVVYIKKELVQVSSSAKYSKPIYYLGAILETNKYYFDTTVLVDKEDNDTLNMFSVKFSDKSKKDWSTNTEYWDNIDFFNGILKKDDYYLDLLKESIKEEDERENFINFLKELKNKNWF